MTTFSVYFGVILLMHLTVALSTNRALEPARCLNLWDEGCVNGRLPGAGRDDDFLSGGLGPGRRCAGGGGCLVSGGEGLTPGRDDFTPGGDGLTTGGEERRHELELAAARYVLARLGPHTAPRPAPRTTY